MLCDIHQNRLPKRYLLELRKPDLTSLGYIEGILNDTYTFEWQAYDTIQFEIAKYIEDENHRQVVNP